MPRFASTYLPTPGSSSHGGQIRNEQSVDKAAILSSNTRVESRFRSMTVPPHRNGRHFYSISHFRVDEFRATLAKLSPDCLVLKS